MKETILIIEDEKDILALLSSLLEGEGYRVITACNGREGIEQFEEHSPDIGAHSASCGGRSRQPCRTRVGLGCGDGVRRWGRRQLGRQVRPAARPGGGQHGRRGRQRTSCSLDHHL